MTWRLDVNLIPGDKPRDIYKYVAGLLQDELEAVERGGVNAIGEHHDLALGEPPGQVPAAEVEPVGGVLRVDPAPLLQDELEAVERGGVNAEHATYWLDLCGRNLPRGLT
jgi:hypothetical protein